MRENIYSSVKEMFAVVSPDLLDFLESEDIFWKKVRDNSITDEELDGHQKILEELGMFTKESAVATAIQIIKSLRHSSLPTPLNLHKPYR